MPRITLFAKGAEGYRLVAEEVVRILEDHGCFDRADGEPGRDKGGGDAGERDRAHPG